MKIQEKCKDWLISVHEWSQKQWLIMSVFTSTMSIWFSLIITFFGAQLKLITVDSNTGSRNFTRLGIILTIGIILFSIVLVCAQRCYEYERLNNNKDRLNLDVLKIINNSYDDMCDYKYATILKAVDSIKRGSIQIPHVISDPNKQLAQIIKHLKDCLCVTLSYNDYKINSNDMYVCLHYNFPKENNTWHLAESYDAERSISTDELLSKDSTFKDIMGNKEDLVFWNSKEQARKLGKYVPDAEDQYDDNNSLKGSIACYRIQIKYQNVNYINAVVSFVTYSKRFVNTDKFQNINNVKYNIKESILKNMEKRLSIELCLLYISKLEEGIRSNNENINITTKVV